MQRYNFTNPLFLFKIDSMIRRFYILFFLVFLVACDDGDILTIDLDFDQELDRCTNDNESYLIFDLRDDPNESLSLIIPRSTEIESLFINATEIGSPMELTINEDTVRFIYRSYNRPVGDDELCEVIQPSSLSIIENYEAGSGKVFITTTFEDDDNDGVPSIFEDLNDNGNYDDDDSDDDGIPNYLDEDDDGDNVKTSNEIDNSDGDNDPTTNPMNTDADLPNGDILPDYLDKDDDGDGIDTRLEDANGMNGPGDDRANNSAGDFVAHYLNNEEVISYTFESYDAFDNAYTRTVKTSFKIEEIDLNILRATEVDFGILTTVLLDFTPAD